jgi:hypothetical protein
VCSLSYAAPDLHEWEISCSLAKETSFNNVNISCNVFREDAFGIGIKLQTYPGIFAFPHLSFPSEKWQGEYSSGPSFAHTHISVASGAAELSPQTSSTFTQTALDFLKFLSHTYTQARARISILGAQCSGLRYLGAHFSPTLQSASCTSRCSLLADVLCLAQKAALTRCCPHNFT